MKPRNHIVLALLKVRKKSGKHEKSYKSIRKQENQKLKDTYNKN